MRIEHVRIVRESGEKCIGTKVTTDSNTVIVFTEKLSKDVAHERARKYEKNPKPVRGLAPSVRRFEEFNFRAARRLSKTEVPLDVPLIRIGKVPLITYMSNKEGKMRSYKHETKRMPTLYMHPSKPFGVIIGGSLKVRDWLYD